MAGRRRKVEATSESIKAEISTIDNKIESLTEEIKQLRVQKKELVKDLAAAERKEAEEKEVADVKAIAAMLKEKNMTVDDLKQFISTKSEENTNNIK